MLAGDGMRKADRPIAQLGDLGHRDAVETQRVPGASPLQQHLQVWRQCLPR